MPKKEQYIADFDSTTSAFTSVANFLKGRGTSSGGVVPDMPVIAAKLINAIPEKIRRAIYRISGWYDAFPPDRLTDIREESLSKWVVDHYPKIKYPAVLIGSANGGAAYISAAMHIAYLPQTFLLPVRRKLPPDNLHEDIEWGRKHAKVLLENNPHLQLHQMHDPLQDRLMVARMAYFRIKKTTAGDAYINFIKRSLPEGGAIFSIECTLQWPVVSAGERHFFQSGGLGALDPGALSTHTPEMEKFLKREKAPDIKLDIPQTDINMPEAEWGYLPGIIESLNDLIREKRLNICRLVFEKPDDFSPFTADLYRWWYTKHGVKDNKLIAECFALIDPWRAQRKHLVPYWLAFNTNPSAEAFNDYLNNADPFDEIYVKLMSNGIKSIGITPVHKWLSIIDRASSHSFLGMDPDKYPLDLGSYGRFHNELDKAVPENNPLPPQLTVEELLQFIKEYGSKYNIEFK